MKSSHKSGQFILRAKKDLAGTTLDFGFEIIFTDMNQKIEKYRLQIVKDYLKIIIFISGGKFGYGMLGNVAWSPTSNPNFSYYMSFRISGFHENQDLEYITGFPKKDLCNDIIRSIQKIENRESNLQPGQIPSNFQVRSLSLKLKQAFYFIYLRIS